MFYSQEALKELISSPKTRTKSSGNSIKNPFVRTKTTLLKKTGSKPLGTMPKKELCIRSRSNSKDVAKKKQKNRLLGKSKGRNFLFKVDFSVCPQTGRLCVSFFGRHYCKNDMDSWTRREVTRYKSAIKSGMRVAMSRARNRDLLRQLGFVKVERFTAHCVVFNPASRDRDANWNSIKAMIDTFIVHNIVAEDNRECLLKLTEDESLSSRENDSEQDLWKIVILLDISS
ncbi:MAG: hypothetical protein HOG49_10670 [Candidatus Scalindua sp.]|mgnify:CR=1 FL=1|jgi:hypothetical protein|nr:hypothetical protein [Candidatus Scalindua sp.]